MNQEFGRELFDVEAEKAVLGSILDDPLTIEEISAVVSPKDFWARGHKMIFKAMIEIHAEGREIDEITVGDHLREQGQLEECGGYVYLGELLLETPSSENCLGYASIVKKRSQERSIIDQASKLIRAVQGHGDQREELAKTSKLLGEIVALRVGGGGPGLFKPIEESFIKVQDRLETKKTEPTSIPGLPTGFDEIDRVTGGPRPGELWILAARPAMGKSALVAQMIRAAAEFYRRKGDPAVFAWGSFEMSGEQNAERMIVQESGVFADKLKNSELDREDWDRLAPALAELHGLGIMIADKASTSVEELTAAVTIMGKSQPVKMLVVDYLQLMRSRQQRRTGANREAEVAEVSRALKMLAQNLGIPVIALSQLNRGLESRSDKRPMLSDLRESGAIEQDADLVMFIYRDEVYNKNTKDRGKAEIIIGKQRTGGQVTVFLDWKGPLVRFENPKAQQMKYGENSKDKHTKKSR